MTCPHCGTQNDGASVFCKKCGRALKRPELEGVITCVNHPNQPATTSCGGCGKRLCDRCAIDIGTIAFCAECAPRGEPTEEERVRRLAVVDPQAVKLAGLGTRITAA